jgi:glycosyltransferase involved in cell wall biosynthesis
VDLFGNIKLNNMELKGYIPKDQRRKILLLCDDIRMHSGISTMAREIVLGTAHRYNWVNLGGAMNHPEQGKRFDLSVDANHFTGITDSSIIMYPCTGYGTPEFLRQIIDIEKPDALMMFTDPRYWVWLFAMESELRKKMPIIYLNIWDDLPAPHYNRAFYESCDALMSISKQTLNINRLVLKDKASEKILKYVPHGINEKFFFPIESDYPKYQEYQAYKKAILKDKEYDFVVFFNSRNIRRKNPGDVILAYKTFLDGLTKEQAKKCALLMHTQPVDENGTDLNAVRDLLCDPEYCNVIFSDQRAGVEQMNMLYNMIDCTMLISSNEGWGLSLTESMMCGKMIIGNVTGGMQDQMRFIDQEGNWINFTDKFPSNHFGTYKTCGRWAKPVFPSNISLLGSVPTPYIFDDRCDFRDVAKAIREIYDMSPEERKSNGLAGREWVLSEESMMSAKHMCDNVIDTFDTTFENWTPRSSYELLKVEPSKPIYINHPVTY